MKVHKGIARKKPAAQSPKVDVSRLEALKKLGRRDGVGLMKSTMAHVRAISSLLHGHFAPHMSVFKNGHEYSRACEKVSLQEGGLYWVKIKYRARPKQGESSDDEDDMCAGEVVSAQKWSTISQVPMALVKAKLTRTQWLDWCDMVRDLEQE